MDASIVSQARRPRGLVKVNGSIVPGWLEWETEQNTFREADTFRVVFALSLLQAPFDEAWFLNQTTLSIELFGGFPDDPNNYSSTDLDSEIVGNVDEVAFDPVARTLTLSGRDLTALLIDAKTAEKWNNQTASEVANTLANRHGLKPVVTSTKGFVGGYYQIDHVVTTCAQTEWDLLCWLAQQVQFVVYVKGHELHFEPQPDASTAPQYPINWVPADSQQTFRSNASQLSFQRTLTVGKTIAVEVRSFNQQQRAGFRVIYPKKQGSQIKPGEATSPAQLYSYNVPNLTLEQATQRAQSIYNDLIKNEMRLTAEMPADNVLDTLHVIPVSGTGTVFDQTYFPHSITRTMSMHEGYRMRIAARNHSEAVAPVEE